MGKRRKGGNNPKTPKSHAVPGPSKEPRQAQEIDFWNSTPVWKLSRVDFVGFGDHSSGKTVGWSHVTQENFDELHARFCAWESMTWRQILIKDKKKNHSIATEKLYPGAQARLRVLQLDDLDSVVSLRVNSKARVFGILDRAEFQILWWDPTHLVCPSKMKHT